MKNPSRLARSWIVCLALWLIPARESRADIPVVIPPDAAKMEQNAARDLAYTLLRLHPGEAFPVATNLPDQGR